MDTETAVVKESFGALSQERGSPVGLVLQLDLPFKEWKERCASVSLLRKFSLFALGDLFVYGEKYPGEKRYDAIESTGYTKAVILRCEWVAKCIPFDHRRLDLSFEHHATLAAIKQACATHADGVDQECAACAKATFEELDHWLELAAKKKWTVVELKDEYQDHQNKQAAATDGKAKRRERKEHKAEEAEVFDPKALQEAVQVVRHHMMVLRPRLARLVTKKGSPDQRRLKAVFEASKELIEAIGGLHGAIDDAFESSRALAK
jgi:disulfide oxidoreductase YuzD